MNYSICYKKETITDMYIDSLKKKLSKSGFVYDEDNPNYVFFLGGDGTFLRAVHKYIDKIETIKFVGLNAGTLGFFLDYSTNDIDDLISDILNNNINAISYPLLRADIISRKEVKTIYAVNEIRVENPFRSLVCDVSIEDHKLETFAGNGLVVASSLGSSAYNKSLGGAIIEHNLPLLEITEIAAIQNNAYRSLASSLIIGGDKKISLKGKFSDIVIGYDHEFLKEDKKINEVRIVLSNKHVNLMRKVDHNYIDVLRKAFIIDKEM
ncbi:MAG: NAD kinase [Erysipelotrichales bacterium]|nr:NAD kinase [Erysipelotrichales bacterium]